MSESVNFSKQVFNKGQYTKVIDTSFKELGVLSIQEQILAQPTVTEFFELYNSLFYQIPELGPVNSHEYLIKKSSEYILYDPNQEEILALQNEIAQLRKDLLQAQIDKAEALVGRPLGINVDNVDVTNLSGTSEYNNILKEVNSNPAVNTTNTTIVSDTPSNPTSQAV